MSEEQGTISAAAATRMMQEMGLAGFMTQMDQVQKSLSQVAQGMDAIGQNAVRQTQDTDNLAAHILAIEALLTVVLRHVPIDMAEVSAEVGNRTRNMSGEGAVGPDVVQRLAEDIVKKAQG